MSNQPHLSVIIASYNPGHLIEDCLDSLKKQQTSRPFEVIVVDSSTDGTARRIQEKFPDIRLCQFPDRKFCGDARNIGISTAQGKIVAFLDADCRADRNWVDRILKDHQTPAPAIGGAIANGNPESLIGWAAYFCEFSQWMPCSLTKGLTDIAGANMSYKKEIFREYGGLIEGTYSSDTDFHWRLKKNGLALQFDPKIIVFHHNIDQLSGFLKHEFDHGQSFARVRISVQDFPKWRKWFYGAFFLILPGWLFLKIMLRNLKNRVYLFHFLKVCPLLILGLISWSLGECVGYVRGIPFPRKKCFPCFDSGCDSAGRTDDSLSLKKETRSGQSFPFFSIIIPTYNRPRKLSLCLESIARLDYPNDRFEVIVVNDGDQSSFQPVVEDFLNQFDVTLLIQAHAGPGAARNTGAKRAKGEFLVFIDDDCTSFPDWLRRLANRFAETPDHAIGGRTLNAFFENLYSTASQNLMDASYAYHNPIPSRASFFASNNLTVPAAHFHSIGGFDTTFITSEDRNFCDRWRHHGFQMTYAPEILISHSHPINFCAFWRRHFNYGRGAYRYHQARARRGAGRLCPSLKFYMSLFFNSLIKEQKRRVVWVKMLLAISQVANAMGFFWEAFNQIKRS